jgi:hypothetical protein
MVKLAENKNYLKTANVKNGDVITFQSEGEWIESRKFTNKDGSPKSQFIIKVGLNGTQFDMSLNGMNRKALINAFGDETSGWNGRKASINVVKSLVSGEMKDVIVLTPMNGEVKKPEDIDWAE